ncbi:MAG: RluA family pseudouridine synthase [Tumebacillaceae bacterium]
MNRDELCSLTVDAALDGQMVRDVLRHHLQMSRKLIRKLVEGEGVLVNGKHTWLSWRLQEGDTLRLLLPTEESEDILSEPIPFATVYEDEDVLVVNKRAGLIVHPTHGHWTGTLANGVVHAWKERGVTARFRPVHRIDQHTSGLLVIAKNHYALKLLAGQLMERTLERSYTAIVHGRVEWDEGRIEGPIDRSDEDRRIRVVRPDGQEARTDYRVVERFGMIGTLVSLKLHTGRTHQIRVHMQYIGHPLFGDAMYGTGDDAAWIERQALHAQVLGFVHPRTGETLRFEAPLPEDMAQLLDALRSTIG